MRNVICFFYVPTILRYGWYTNVRYPPEFKRFRLPVKFCAATTINKIRGQTLKLADVDSSDSTASLVNNIISHVLELAREIIYIFVQLIEKRTITKSTLWYVPNSIRVHKTTIGTLVECFFFLVVVSSV